MLNSPCDKNARHVPRWEGGRRTYNGTGSELRLYGAGQEGRFDINGTNPTKP